MIDFRQWLLRKMGDNELTQKDVADRSGLSETLISKILALEKPVTCKSAISIARAVGGDVFDALYVAGHISEQEYGVNRRWISDMPEIKELCDMLIPLRTEDRERLRSLIKTCLEFKGGDALAKPEPTQTGYG